MVRCITPGCEGTKLAAKTVAEWNAREENDDVFPGFRGNNDNA
jgi:hypothetical protein